MLAGSSPPKEPDCPGVMMEMENTTAVPAFRPDCPCKKKKCERHGLCLECHAYHAEGKARPFCLRKELPGDFAPGSFAGRQAGARRVR